MGKFNFIKTPIQDLYVIEPTVYGDDRGYFMETYNEREFNENGLTMKFLQHNQSKSKKGVLRGLHFQKSKPQGKLCGVIDGSVYDVAVDLRGNSPTFLKWYGIELTGENKKQFYIPEGFAHGFLVLSESAIFSYKCTNLYDPNDESGIMWNDEKIGVKWPIKDEIILSERDKNNKTFDELGFKY